MVNYAFSAHALEQIALRGLAPDMVEAVLKAPDKIIEEGDGQVIYQSLVKRDEKDCLLRVFVNSNKIPNLVKTVYLTSKISKYR
ncbi:hypothetical protein GCM10027341_25380 [Spirosoma knui]